MTDEWDEHADIWDQDEYAQFFAEQAFASLSQHIDLADPVWKQRRVLDFGCGTGLLADKLAPSVGEIVLVDTSAAMLEVLRAKQIPGAHIYCADILDDTVRSAAAWFGEFDLIVASSVFGMLPNYPRAVRVLASALKPSGWFAQWDWLLADDAEEDDEEDGLSLAAVSAAIRDAGLVQIEVAHCFDVTFEDDDVEVLIGAAFKL